MPMSLAPDRGIALVTVLLVSSLVFTMAVGLSLVLAVDHLVVGHHRESAALQFAAAAGVELAASALGDMDWNVALAGGVQAGGSDGTPSGTRIVDGLAAVDLSRETSLLNCGSPLACSDAQLRAVTASRPWGANNPHWRLFLYGPLATLSGSRFASPAYVLVWVADDGRETDGDPEVDGGGAGAAGQGVLRVRAVALGRGLGRRGFEAELVRVCRPAGGEPGCQPGIRVQSWRDLRHALP
jgi:hypothetical protein